MLLAAPATPRPVVITPWAWRPTSTPITVGFDAVPATALGLVESRVGVGDEAGSAVVGVRNVGRDAEADRHGQTFLLKHEGGRLDGGTHALGQDGRGIEGNTLTEDRKLFPAVASE